MGINVDSAQHRKYTTTTAAASMKPLPQIFWGWLDESFSQV